LFCYPLNLNIYSLPKFALRIGYPPTEIEKIIEKKLSSIREFDLEKVKNDGTLKKRHICNPKPKYKKLLKNINTRLLTTAKFPRGVYGGIPGYSISDMVEAHCGNESFYIVDLKDFFPSIEYDRVLKFFLYCKCSKEIAKLLADLLTHNDCIPQGFPTSTMLANLIVYKLDIEHINICTKYNIIRTRWIDDIAFSGKRKDLEKAIPAINTAIKYNDLIINKDKSHIRMRRQKPEIVGICVKWKKPKIPRSYVEKIQEIVDFIKKYGVKQAKSVYEEEFFRKNIKKSLEGKLRYIASFNPPDAKCLYNSFNSIEWNN